MEYNRIIVGTSVFIEFLRKKNKTKSELFKIPDETIIMISSVTLFELFAGATDKNKWKDVKDLTDDLFIIPFDKEIAEVAAKIMNDLREKNKMNEFRDIFIAATAFKFGLPVKTINKKHFERVSDLIVI